MGVFIKSQRDFVLQPRVGDACRLPWETSPPTFNPKGVAAGMAIGAAAHQIRHPPRPEPRWGS